MKPQLIRQGDVLVKPTRRRVSVNAKPVSDRGRIILAYGEVTGHAHEVVPATRVVNADPVPAMQLFEEPDGTRLLVVKGPAELRHEEHGTLAIAPGSYEVIRQREYSPTAIRNVAD